MQLLKHVEFILSMSCLALDKAYWSRIICISLILRSLLDVGSENEAAGGWSASLGLDEEKEENIDDIIDDYDDV